MFVGRSKLRVLCAALFLAPVFVGCEGESPLERVGDASSDLLVSSSLTWPLGAPIPVCWLNPTSADATARGWVKSSVEATWQASSAARFSGWGTCASPSVPGIRIQVEDTSAAPSSVVGTQANGMVGPSAWFNFTFKNWAQNCQSTPEYCVRAYSVHEFGHMLAFIHEQERPDNPSPSTCVPDANGPYGDRVLGPWDPNSIMSYCNPVWNEGGLLSPGDVAGVQMIYGLPSPWSQGDIGSPALAGSASIVAGAYRIGGGGADIWGTSDQFHYVHQTLTGDGTIVARVTGVQATNPSSKAGVMIRETLAAGSKHASMVLTPTDAIFEYRDAVGATSHTATHQSASTPSWVKLVRSGTTLTGYRGSDGTTWTQVGSIALSMASKVYVGLAVTAHDKTKVQTATFDGVGVIPASSTRTFTLSGTVVGNGWTQNGYGIAGVKVALRGAASRTTTTDANGQYAFTGLLAGGTYTVAPSAPGYAFSPAKATTPGLPSFTTNAFTSTSGDQSGWTDVDVGDVGAVGSASQSNSFFTLFGSGGDIGGTDDAFHYTYRSLSGNGQLVARLYANDASNAGVKSGVMIRESLASNARHAAVLVTPIDGIHAEARAMTGGSTSDVTSAGGPSQWVKITRSGDTLTTYASPDGVTWTRLRSDVISGLAQDLTMGLAQSSHARGATAWAMLDRVMASQ